MSARGRAVRRRASSPREGRPPRGLPLRVTIEPVTVPLVEARHLVKHFPVRGPGFFARAREVVRAVDGVSLQVAPGEIVALVGESGCGKSTVGRLLVRLLDPTSGDVLFDGESIFALGPRELRAARRRFQIVFQDPDASLDPRLTVGQSVAEGLEIHRLARGRALRDRVADLLAQVGLLADHAARYPHELSGGQKQRVGIARALAVEPRFIVLDEAVSALDVSVQAQIVNLLLDLRARRGLAYLFVSHDLALVSQIADRVAVMYLGEIVEEAPADRLFAKPLHPYTQALLAATPVPDPERTRQRLLLPGEPPSAIDPPPGCRFHPRCARAIERCRIEAPARREIATENRRATCHLIDAG
ncbi:MAG: ABC transporter ATP-binding protein [Planctomycetes bacterium]|nr:ABC transporter ATP-binding protein [Planctomycetota bacterium]